MSRLYAGTLLLVGLALAGATRGPADPATLELIAGIVLLPVALRCLFRAIRVVEYRERGSGRKGAVVVWEEGS